MNKHFLNCTSIALCALNTVAFGGGLNLNRIKPSTYLSPNQNTGLHIVAPLVVAVGLQKMKPEHPRKQPSPTSTKKDGAMPVPFMESETFAAYASAVQVGAVGHTIGTAVSLVKPELGNQICYHANRTPILLAAWKASNFAGSCVFHQIGALPTTQLPIVLVATLASYMGMTTAIDFVLEKAGVTGPEEMLK